MKLRISSAELNAVLKDVTRATEAKSAVPWMCGVLLEVNGTELRATCTNGTQTISRYADCEVREAGKALLDGKLLLNVASKLPACDCEIDTASGKKAVIKAGGSKTNMALMDEKAFVMPADIQQMFSFRADAGKLFAAFKNVLYAVPVQDTRATLTGVNVQSKVDVLHLCGMDGYRMGIAKVAAAIDGQDFSIIIPRKTVVDMLGLCPALDEEIVLRSDGKHIAMNNGKVTLQSQLVAGEYVNYKQVIQKMNTSCKAMFDVQQLKDAVSRAMVMCEGKNNLLRVVADENGLTVSGMGDVGDATETVECIVNGDGLEIGFNGRLLFEALNAIAESEAVVQFSSSVGPALITSANQGGWMHCVLPVRTH